MDFNNIDNAIESYDAVEDEATKSRLRFFRGLWEVEQALSERFAQRDSAALPEREAALEAYRSHKPLASLIEFSASAEEATQVCQEVATYLSSSDDFETDIKDWMHQQDWARILHACDYSQALAAPDSYLEAVGKVLAADTAFDQQKVSLVQWVLMTMIRVYAQPVAAALMERAQSEDSASETHSLTCPVCGSPATLAVVGPTSHTNVNGRRLYCGYCGTLWEFERVRCARCGTQDQTKLNYFNLEGDEAHRLYDCQECGSYIRTVWQPSLPGPLCCQVEDVVMARLDAVALSIMDANR